MYVWVILFGKINCCCGNLVIIVWSLFFCYLFVILLVINLGVIVFIVIDVSVSFWLSVLMKFNCVFFIVE